MRHMAHSCQLTPGAAGQANESERAEASDTLFDAECEATVVLGCATNQIHIDSLATVLASRDRHSTSSRTSERATDDALDTICTPQRQSHQ